MSLRKQRVANLLCWYYAAAVLLSAWIWLSYRLVHELHDQLWLDLFFLAGNAPAGASLISVVLLAVVTHGLAHRKRAGLVMVLLFQIFGVLSSTVIAVPSITDPTTQDFMLTAIFTGWLLFSLFGIWLCWWLWPVFPAKLVRGSWLRAFLVLLSGSALATAIGTLIILVYRSRPWTVWEQVQVVLMQAIGMTSDNGWGGVHPPRPATIVVSVLLSLTLIATVTVFTRSVRPQDSWNPSTELALRHLLNDHAEDDSLAYVVTRRDRLIHFDATRSAAIGYQVIGSVALASGDPIGNREKWDDAITEWHDTVREYGWTPGVIACGPDGARAYSRTLGFEILRLGDESVLETASFDLGSTAMTEVRRAHARSRRSGLTAEIEFQSEMSPEAIDETRTLTARWRIGDERGFSMEVGRIGDPADERMVVAMVRDITGHPVAILTFLPWGRHGLSLDLMRRSPQAPNGVNEFLVAEVMAWAADHGIERVSLNFAFLRHIFARAEDVAAAPGERFSSRLLGALDRYWQIQRLYRSNTKYRPDWRPRYFGLPSPLMLVPVGVASMLAEGFIPDWFHMLRSAPAGAGLTSAELTELRETTRALPPGSDTVPRSDQSRHRIRHLHELQDAGQPGYPVASRTCVELADLAEDATVDPSIELVGRVRSLRDHGGVCFIDLVDGMAHRQLVVEAEAIGRESLRQIARLVDSGDLLGVHAHSGESRNGTPSLLVDSWQILAKALQPIPWWGFNDPRARARSRSLDLLVHPEQMDLLAARSRAITSVRRTLVDAGFCEVETPMLNTVHGGANARPFRTHINAYDTDLVLRIAPELALKRLVVAGMGAIFEIGKNFRNEGADASHNPEFTVVEAYQPYADYTTMRLLTQRIIQEAATAVHGRPVMPLPTGPDGKLELTDISGDWAVVSVCDAVSEAVGTRIDPTTDLDELIGIAQEHGIHIGPDWGAGKLIEELYGELAEATTVAPTFYVDFPAETSPLTAPHRTQPGLVERWDLVAGGMELGTAYSELTDPIIQRQRLVEQSWHAAMGDAEAMEVDEDFLTALELGMPPTGGLGIGLDRLVMALTGSSIRQVLTFPFIRPQR